MMHSCYCFTCHKVDPGYEMSCNYSYKNTRDSQLPSVFFQLALNGKGGLGLKYILVVRASELT